MFTPDRLANACVDTQRKPYDFLVCVTLILADHFAPGAKAISSMGGVSDWWPALDFVRKNIESSVVLPEGVDPERVSDPAVQKSESAPLEIIQKGANNAPASLFF